MPRALHDGLHFKLVKYWTNSKVPDNSLSWTFDGVITMFESEKGTNGKLLLKPTEDSLNQQ